MRCALQRAALDLGCQPSCVRDCFCLSAALFARVRLSRAFWSFVFGYPRSFRGRCAFMR